MSTFHCILYTLQQCTMYNVHFSLYTVQFTPNGEWCTLYTVHFMQYNVFYYGLYTVHFMQYSTVDCIQYSLVFRLYYKVVYNTVGMHYFEGCASLKRGLAKLKLCNLQYLLKVVQCTKLQSCYHYNTANNVQEQYSLRLSIFFATARNTKLQYRHSAVFRQNISSSRPKHTRLPTCWQRGWRVWTRPNNQIPSFQNRWALWELH